MNKEYQDHKTVLIPTGSDIEGPFYKAGAPVLGHVLALPDKYTDPRLYLTGRVLYPDGSIVKGVVLDVWQADAAGHYDDSDEFKLRGKFHVSDLDGVYAIETIHPGHYEIGPSEFRCSHIHVKIWIVDKCVLTTQLYFEDDEYDSQDHWFDAKRCVKIVGTDRLENLRAEFDFILPSV